MIDLELQKKSAEQELMALLSGQAGSLPQDIAGIQAKVQGTRDFSPASDYAASLGLGGGADVSHGTNTLNRELSKNLAGSEFSLSRQNLGNRQSALGQFQNSAIAARRGRESNVRNVQGLMSSQAFQSGQSALDRQAAIESQASRENAMRRGMDLEQQYANPQYGNPLVRMLATLGGTVGTSLLLKSALTPKVPTVTPPAYNPQIPYNFSGNTPGYGFNQPDFLMGGETG